MYLECRHIKPNGSKCRAAALKGKPYCYYHIRLHAMLRRLAAPCAPYEQRELQMPFLEDRGAIQIALSEVVSAIAARRIDLKSAALLIYALQVASSNARVSTDVVADQQVRDSFETEEGEVLAPEATTYEPKDPEYRDGYGEPTLAQLLLNEVKRHRDEDEAEAEAEPRENTETPGTAWSGDPWAGRSGRT
jgi:hypothetical protein